MKNAFQIIHQDASYASYQFLCRWIFGIWFVYILFDPLTSLAQYPWSLYFPTGFLLKLCPASVSYMLTSFTFLLGLKSLLILSLAAVLLGAYKKWAALLTCVLLSIYEGLVRSFGHVNHPELPLLLAVFALTVFFFFEDSMEPEALPISKYGIALISVLFIFLFSYCFSGIHRLVTRGWEIYTTNTLSFWVLEEGKRSRLLNWHMENLMVTNAIVREVMKLGFPLVTLCEIAAPFCLISKSFRYIWLSIMVPFHIIVWIFMGIFFWANFALYIFLFDFSALQVAFKSSSTGPAIRTLKTIFFGQGEHWPQKMFSKSLLPSKKQFIFFRRLPMHPQGEWGGLEKLMLDWFQRIDYTQTQVVLVVTDGWRDRFILEAQRRSTSFKVEQQPFDFFKRNAWQRFWDMWRFLKDYSPAGIVFFQAHHAEFGLPELIAAFWRSKGNVFMHENSGCLKPLEKSSRKHFGFIPGLGLWWEYDVLCIQWRAYVTKKVLTVSQEIKNRYMRYWKYPAHKVLVTYHGVNTQDFSPAPDLKKVMRQKLNFSDQDKILIQVARFTTLKRLDRTIRAFNRVYSSIKNVHLVLLGDGPLQVPCRRLSSSLPCSEHIHFEGQVDNPINFLRMADIFLLSSDNEGLSLALMEAMSCGLIVVSTDCPGSNELIQDTKTGFIVRKSDASMAEGIKKALHLSAIEIQQMRQAAIDSIHEGFDIDRNVQKVFRAIGISYCKDEPLKDIFLGQENTLLENTFKGSSLPAMKINEYATFNCHHHNP